jgi:protein-disulfide isomerase-like protein with CxxC motif
MSESREVHVIHSTSPGCHWSWGYEAVLNRLRLVYGDQVRLHVALGCPYESWDQWLQDYGMTEPEAIAWVNDDMASTMGVPLAPMVAGRVPPTMMPATLAALAALREDELAGWRFHRALVRMYAVEGRDPSSAECIRDAAHEAGLNAHRIERALREEEADLRNELETQHERMPPMHAGFYNLIVWDGGDRRVVLDYAFEPEVVEGAIDYLAGGTLRKEGPTDIAAYLREHGRAPLVELRRVFAMPETEMLARLEAMEKAGAAERVTLAGAPHWRLTG